MLYTQYVSGLYSWFWKTPEGKIVASKTAGKEFAKSLGISVPRMYSLPRCVVKPDRQWSSHGVVLVADPSDYVMEELLTDEDGSVPPRDFKWYVFRGQPRMVHVISRSADLRLVADGFYSWPQWQPLPSIMRRNAWLEVKPPHCVDAMAIVAKRIASRFQVAIRVDLYATDRGPVFGELCVTPGGRRPQLTTEGDRMLGSWLDVDGPGEPPGPGETS